jgi:hypothetical protein
MRAAPSSSRRDRIIACSGKMAELAVTVTFLVKRDRRTPNTNGNLAASSLKCFFEAA